MALRIQPQTGPIPRGPRRQRGLALLFVTLLLIVGVGIFVVNASQETARTLHSEESVASALSAAKEALIAYAVAHARPGAFPCPDLDDNGDAEALSAGQCPSYLGRLPWRTLGLGDIRDAAGERYWYALSQNFRDAVAINSDTHGNRVVRSGTAAEIQTSEAVAIVFAPGGILGAQTRDSASAPCATTGTTIAKNLCAANYLDSAAGYDNAAAPGVGPFIGAEAGDAFNDRLLVVRTPDVIPLLERRVAADLKRVIVQYRLASGGAVSGDGCNCYPWPDSNFNGTSNVGDNKGRIPITASPHSWSPQPPAKPLELKNAKGDIFLLPALPAYFEPNNWQSVVFYAVGRNALENFGLAPTACTTCSSDPLLPPPLLVNGTLSVDSTAGYAVVLITPGSAAANRPAGWTGNWGDYIDDDANRDGDDRFVTPVSRSIDRDRVTTIPGDGPPVPCDTNAQVLIKNAPCHTTATESKPVCKKAVTNLDAGFCTCRGEGATMLDEPCRNTLSPPECQSAVATLQGCKL